MNVFYQFSTFRKNATFATFAAICALLFSCASSPDKQKTADSVPEGLTVLQATGEQSVQTLTLAFAGDIMAHKHNVRGNFSEIYKDIEPLLKKSDLAFVNLETTVDDSKEYSSYPNFNVNHAYPDAAISAGFNVFSLANNHTNDYGLDGMRATKKYFEKQSALYADSERKVYSAGIKDSKNAPLTFALIDAAGWKVLYCAVTEVLNRNDFSSYIDYVRPSEKQRRLFLEELKMLRQKNECDLFVLSLHTAEEEYVPGVSDRQKKFYTDILNAGVDIINANHPHIAKEWNVYADENGTARKIVFFSQGNTISGQRREPDFSNPSCSRDYTGDAFITNVVVSKDSRGIVIEQVDPVLITTYITPSWHFVIKVLDDEFIEELKLKKQKTWANYLGERKKLMEKIKGNIIWQ